MERSEQINELAAALALAQAEIEKADKDRTNPAFRSSYATLGSVWDAAKEALTRHGLSVAQLPVPSEKGTLALTTMLLHKSGQFLAGTITMPLAKEDPQGYGSALTYGRRYGLAAMVGVCPEDDDGNAASGHGQHRGHAPQPRHEQAMQRQERPLTEGRKSVWGTNQHAESRGDAAAAEDLNLTAPTEKPTCADCGTDNLPPRVVEFSIKHFSVPVCFDCGKKRKGAA
jgi:hypothetical protein